MTSEVKTRAGIKRQIRLPNREAFKIALRSVRIRFWRSCITMAGIVLTIAFLSSVLTSNVAAQALQPAGAQDIAGALDGQKVARHEAQMNYLAAVAPHSVR